MWSWIFVSGSFDDGLGGKVGFLGRGLGSGLGLESGRGLGSGRGLKLGRGKGSGRELIGGGPGLLAPIGEGRVDEGALNDWAKFWEGRGSCKDAFVHEIR